MAQIDRSSPVPMWHQIEMAIANDINSGAIAPGTQLPNEMAVAARFGVNRHTARRALATLAEKGAVRIRRGLGTFVERPVVIYPISDRTRFTETLQRQNRSASHKLLHVCDQVANGDVAEALALAPATVVTALWTIGLADGIPGSVGVTFCPTVRFPDLAELYRSLGSLTAVMLHFGVGDYRRTVTRITAILPSEEEAAQLRQARGEPVLAVESVDADPSGTPVSFNRVRFAGQRVQLVVGRSDPDSPASE